jgi:CBS domain-containing protein
VFAGEDTPVEALADLMLSHRVNRLPILRSGRAVGIVTREDVLRAIVSLLHADDGTSSGNDEEGDENDQEEPR